MLKDLGIVKSRNNKGYRVFTEHIEQNFLTNEMNPHEYVNYCLRKYRESGVPTNNALNGTIFEIILATVFVKERLLPLHLQAKVAFVPNVIFDSLLYTEENGPIAISMKTSLRERYKQADLEAIALKYVHRKAKNYLITVSNEENILVNNKISTGSIIGIDLSILATDQSFDTFINDLKNYNYITPGQVDIVQSSRIISTENVERLI